MLSRLSHDCLTLSNIPTFNVTGMQWHICLHLRHCNCFASILKLDHLFQPESGVPCLQWFSYRSDRFHLIWSDVIVINESTAPGSGWPIWIQNAMCSRETSELWHCTFHVPKAFYCVNCANVTNTAYTLYFHRVNVSTSSLTLRPATAQLFFYCSWM